MGFFSRKDSKLAQTSTSPSLAPPSEISLGDLRFVSLRALEEGLDGSDAGFARYFYALYRCTPDDGNSETIVGLRNKLREKYPEKAVNVGKRFILTGRPAFEALRSYYYALSVCDTLSEAMRAYWKERGDEVMQRHSDSQGFPIPIDLTEAQLAYDPRLEFLTCVALMQGQVFHRVALGK